MSKSVHLVNRIFAGGCDLTGAANKFDFKVKADAEECTVFGSDGVREYLPGLMGCSVDASGYWDAADASKVDNNRFASTGGIGAWSAFPAANQTLAASAAVGDKAFLSSFVDAEYELLGDVGKVAPWSASATGTWPAVKGYGLHPPGTARTVSGTGTGVLAGAVSATQKLYANLHVLSVGGTGSPSITVEVESDSANTFLTPVTVLSFAPATLISGQSVRASGPITDTWYRAKWTITGTLPSFLFVVTLGIR